MKKISTLLAVGILACSGSVFAQTESMSPSSTTTPPPLQSGMQPSPQPGMQPSSGMHDCDMKNMTPEQHQQMMEQKMQHWQSMTPEDKQMMQSKMQDHWQSMSPDMKKMATEKMMMKWNSMSADEQQHLMQMMQSNMKPVGSSNMSASPSSDSMPPPSQLQQEQGTMNSSTPASGM